MLVNVFYPSLRSLRSCSTCTNDWDPHTTCILYQSLGFFRHGDNHIHIEDIFFFFFVVTIPLWSLFIVDLKYRPFFYFQSCFFEISLQNSTLLLFVSVGKNIRNTRVFDIGIRKIIRFWYSNSRMMNPNFTLLVTN